MLRLGRVKTTALHFRGFIKNGHGPVATEFSLKSRSLKETLENRTITHPAALSLTWFFVVVVDNVDVVVIDADVPMLEISLLVIVRLDCLSSTHHSFPEKRYMLTIASTMITMTRTKLMKMRRVGVLGQNLFPRADNALPEGRGIARPNSPPTRFLLQNFPFPK